MLKILRLLKSSMGTLLVVIALLALQAYCDLSLPSYTSDIVDVGITSGGIEDTVPVAIRESQMNLLLGLMNTEEQSAVLDSYELVNKDDTSNAKYEDYLKEYKALANENIYVLNEDAGDLDSVRSILTKNFLIIGWTFGETEEAKELNTQISASLPAGTAEYPLIQKILMLPTEQSQPILSEISKSFSNMPETYAKQGAISMVKAEYKALGINTDKLQTNYIMVAGLKMLGLALVAMISTILVGYLASRIAAGLGRDLRGRVFNKVVGFSNNEFDHFSTASLITRSTNDIQQIQMTLVMMIRIVFYSPILAIGGIIKVLNTNVSMTWIIALAIVLIMTVIGTLFAVAMPKFKLLQKLMDRINLVTREILTGLSVIRAFSKERQEEKRFDVANQDLTKVNLFTSRVMTFMMPIVMFIMNGITVLILWAGAHGIDQGDLQVGHLMAFIQYSMQIIMSFLMFSMISIMLPRASVSAGRIMEVIDEKPTIHDPEKAESFDNSKKGYVEFENVSFRYPKAEDDVLSGITFTAKPGQTTAIIGSTGSGKSTLVHLIPRFYDITGGSLKVSGVDIRNVCQHDLREKLGFVPQKGVLFSGTIESNVKFGKQDATTEEIIKAARISQSLDFIEEKDEKFNSPISQGGTNVSGGQKQRLSIARAIAKDPEIYIFDDSFSALDYKTEVVLRKALKQETGDSTVIIVAQRISTIIHADQIIVLDDGKIVGKGTHEELLKNCEVYNQIALSQLSKEELSYE